MRIGVRNLTLNLILRVGLLSLISCPYVLLNNNGLLRIYGLTVNDLMLMLLLLNGHQCHWNQLRLLNLLWFSLNMMRRVEKYLLVLCWHRNRIHVIL